MAPSQELQSQWSNPSDILSFLLLIGGSTIQQAITQLHGYYVQSGSGRFRVYLTPVAFSFGWLGYTLLTLNAMFGDKELMPSEPNSQTIVINCDNGYKRVNRSWLLSRLLRDHEMEVGAHPGPEAAKLDLPANKEATGRAANDPPPRISLRIDLFQLEDQPCPSIDFVWLSGWGVILFQLSLATVPWICYGNWSVFMITSAGTCFALLTGSLRQWQHEKWPGRRPNGPRELPTATADGPTRAAAAPADVESGQRPPQQPPKRSKFLMGSGPAWDLETFATADSELLWETRLCLLALTLFWVFLLISVSGLESHTWYLIAIGGAGMLQNIYAASARRKPECLGLRMRPYEERPTIIGCAVEEKKFWILPNEVVESNDEAVTAGDELVSARLEPWKTVGVRGALRELEKTVPRAGMALMPEFFPAALRVDRERYRDGKELQFWRWMDKRPSKEKREPASE